MFNNVMMTMLTPLGNTNEVYQWENMPFSNPTVWPEQYVQDTKKYVPVTGVKKRKQKRIRTAFTTEQLNILEKAYAQSKYITIVPRMELAAKINVSDKCVKVWFQNRRMKDKRQSSESSGDSCSEASHEISPSGIKKPVSTHFNAQQQNVSYLNPQYKYPETLNDLNKRDYIRQASPDMSSSNVVQTTPDYHYDHYSQNWDSNQRNYFYQNTVSTQYPSDVQNALVPTDQLENFDKGNGVYPINYYPSNNDYSCSENSVHESSVAVNSNLWSTSDFDFLRSLSK